MMGSTTEQASTRINPGLFISRRFGCNERVISCSVIISHHDSSSSINCSTNHNTIQSEFVHMSHHAQGKTSSLFRSFFVDHNYADIRHHYTPAINNKSTVSIIFITTQSTCSRLLSAGHHPHSKHILAGVSTAVPKKPRFLHQLSDRLELQ